MSSALRSIVISCNFVGIVLIVQSNGFSIPDGTSSADVVARNTSAPSNDYKIVCDLGDLVQRRHLLEHANSTSCTHVVLGFATLDGTSLTMKPEPSWLGVNNPFYDLLKSYKQRGIKVMLGLIGWNNSASEKFSRMVGNTTSRKTFITHALGFLEANAFNGLHLSWKWPVCWGSDCAAGPASDKENFSQLVEELSAAFRPRGLLLSAIIHPLEYYLEQIHNLPVITNHLDWISVQTYSYFGWWNGITEHTATLYSTKHSATVNHTVNYLISKVPSRKIVIGIPFFGQALTVKNPETGVGLNAPASVGEDGPELKYYEICERIKNRDWTVVKDPLLRMGPYAYKGNQWVSFDNAEMVRHKAQYIRDMNLGGVMAAGLGYDDFLGTCGEGKHPLIRALQIILADPLEADNNCECRRDQGESDMPVN